MQGEENRCVCAETDVCHGCDTTQAFQVRERRKRVMRQCRRLLADVEAAVKEINKPDDT